MKPLLSLLSVGILATQLGAQAETPEQVQERLGEYRQRSLDAQQVADEKLQREYGQTWKPYGDIDVNRKRWKQERSGSWTTDAEFLVSRWTLVPCHFKPSCGFAAFPRQSKIAVSCSSLMVNQLPIGRWEGWTRPAPGDPLEQLIVDRCSVPPNL